MTTLVDTNILVYACMPAMAEHAVARAWLSDRFGDSDTFVGVCWPTLYGMVRLVSSRRIMGEHAASLPDAWNAADAFRRQPNARMIEPGPSHPHLAATLIATPGLTSNDVPDVYLAALAMEHGLSLATHDRGFARFSGLRWNDPLSE